jgi:hypothetical protein
MRSRSQTPLTASVSSPALAGEFFDAPRVAPTLELPRARDQVGRLVGKGGGHPPFPANSSHFETDKSRLVADLSG